MHGDVVLRPVGEGEQPAAAHLVEGLSLRGVVRVPDVHVGLVRLHDGGVQHVVVGAALVAEALALQVQLQEGLLAEPEPAAEHAVAGVLVGLHAGAVEGAGRADRVHSGAEPQRRFNAGTGGVAAGAGGRDADLLVPGLAVLHHLQVVAVAAGGEDDAATRVDAQVGAVALHVAGDDAGHAAGLVGLAFDELAVPARLGALLGGVSQDGLGEAPLLVLGHGIGFLRTVAGGEGLVAARVGGVAHAALEFHDELAVALDDVGEPVYHGAGLVGPQLHQVVVHKAVGVADDVLDGLFLLDAELRELVEGGLLQARIDGADVLADVMGGALAVDAEHLRTVLGRRDHGRDAAGAHAHHEHLGVDGLGDVGLIDDGRRSQPGGAAEVAGARIGRLGGGVAVPAAGEGRSGQAAQGRKARALEEAATCYVTGHWEPPIPRAGSDHGTRCRRAPGSRGLCGSRRIPRPCPDGWNAGCTSRRCRRIPTGPR